MCGYVGLARVWMWWMCSRTHSGFALALFVVDRVACCWCCLLFLLGSEARFPVKMDTYRAWFSSLIDL